MPVDEEGVELTGADDLFLSARPGDTLMTPFQCDLCHFRNVKGRNPFLDNDRDKLALTMIRRANLDAFWARTAATVQSNLSDFRQQVKHSLKLWGGTPNLPPRGPFPLEDNFGVATACVTLSRSLDPGKNARHIQFNTARRIRSSFSNYWNASIKTLSTGVMQDGQAKLMMTDCPVYHFWYTRMMCGMHERMGDLVIQDQAVSRELQEALMEEIEEKLTTDPANYDKWVEVGTLAMMLWLGALRGNEAMMASLDGCIKMMNESAPVQGPGKRFGVLVLVGKFKASTGKTRYMLYLSSDTKSKFTSPFREWLSRLITVRQRQGRESGWLFANDDGSPLPMTHFECDLLNVISEIQDKTEGIIPKELDVFERYGLFRSWRRGATSIVRNEGILSREDIELNNWWRKMEDSRGKHVSGDMLAYYTEDLLVMDAKKRFSESL